jgi:hypothetical protein
MLWGAGPTAAGGPEYSHRPTARRCRAWGTAEREMRAPDGRDSGAPGTPRSAAPGLAAPPTRNPHARTVARPREWRRMLY